VLRLFSASAVPFLTVSCFVFLGVTAENGTRSCSQVRSTDSALTFVFVAQSVLKEPDSVLILYFFLCDTRIEMLLAFKLGRAAKNPAEVWYKGELGFYDFYSTYILCSCPAILQSWTCSSLALSLFAAVIPLAKKLKECGVFGVSRYVRVRACHCHPVQ